MERIIAKIENDFNPDNTDWIPRVPAWCFDAMQQLKVLSVVKKRRKLDVIDKVAYTDCCIIQNELKVYDKYGCEIRNIKDKCNRCDTSFTGSQDSLKLSDTLNVIEGAGKVDYGESFTEHINNDNINHRYNTYTTKLPVENRNYILVDDNHIELNFNTDCIIIENLEIATAYSDYFQSEVPVIPDDGNLLEALAYYCLYKMLCRGMKHPVFNLNASQYGTNPYYMWTQLKNKAKASVINTRQGDIDTKAWQSYFYNYTFKPKK